jgi:predicted dehydrogenase
VYEEQHGSESSFEIQEKNEERREPVLGTIGVGVIGVGTFGRQHARIYSEHPQVELLAVADINEDSARQVADIYGVKAYSDYEQMLADPGIHAISVVVPDTRHREPCISAASRGKHILVEKPLATSVDDGKAIIEAAEKNNVILMVDFMNHWNPPFAAARKSILQGEIGELLYINMKLNDSLFVPTKMLSWAAESSVLWFLGSHTIDLTCWMVGDAVYSVSCFSQSRFLNQLGIATADFYRSTLEFKNGVVANIENSWVLPEAGPTIFEFTAEIVGTQGKIDIDTARNGSIIKTTGSNYTYPDSYCLVEIEGQLRGFGHLAIEHFIHCVINNEKPTIENNTSLEVTRIILSLEQASRKRKTIIL